MPLMRGALPSPRHKLAAATPHRIQGAPPQYANVPKQLSMWGNSTYGCCVTSEEAFSKVAAAPNVFVSEQDVIRWAGQNGFLNGANLTDVMDVMQTMGLPSGGKSYQDGPYKSVDWTHRAVLCDALYQGPVKIAVAANQLEGTGAGNRSGWFGTHFRPDPNSDHCVALTGYGTLSYLFGQLGLALPGGADPNAFGYLLFTWNTIGVIDEPSMVAITSEAWLRNPTTAGFIPPPPPPPLPVPDAYPAYHVEVSGSVPTLFGHQTVVLAGTAKPLTSVPQFPEQSPYFQAQAALPYWAVIQDVMAIVADYRAHNLAAVVADVQKLLADLGIHLPV